MNSRTTTREKLKILANQPIFTTMISTIEHFAKDISDSQTAKLSFSVLARMVLTWGGSGSGAAGSVTHPDTGSQAKLPGFDNFMITTFSPICWAAPTNPKFDAKDAQGKQVLSEAAALQKAIYIKTGQDYINYLRDVELSGMGMDSSNIDRFVDALCNADMKSFQQFFRVRMPILP